MKKTEEIEFLNDVIYYAHPRGQVDFEWIIAPQLGIEKVQKRMLEMIGATGNMDDKLVKYLDKLTTNERLVFEARLKELKNTLESGNLVKKGNYVP